MISIASTLLTEDVLLDFRPESPEDAIRVAAELLKEDERVIDWDAFEEALVAHPPCKVDDAVEFGICLPHARTAAVEEMVMSAARFDEGLMFPGCAKPVRYLFCLGVPQALAADYLRIAGALMRIFKDPVSEGLLRAAATPAAFVEILTRLERKL